MQVNISKEDFLDMAVKLGLKINRPNPYISSFVDIESFFLYSTIFIRSDYRTARYIEYWAHAYGKYLSVKKINDLIDKGHSYDPVYLFGLLRLIDRNFEKGGPFKILKRHVKKNLNAIPIIEGFDFKKIDPVWESVGVIAPIFIPDEYEKVIREINWLEKNCPELYFRIIGLSPILSDIKSYVLFNKNVSLYKVSKDLGLTYSCVHSNYSRHIKPLQMNF